MVKDLAMAWEREFHMMRIEDKQTNAEKKRIRASYSYHLIVSVWLLLEPVYTQYLHKNNKKKKIDEWILGSAAEISVSERRRRRSFEGELGQREMRTWT